MRIKSSLFQSFSRVQAEQIARALSSELQGSTCTQIELARKMSTSQPRISRLLSGQFSRRTLLLERLCAYLDVNLDALAGQSVERSLYAIDEIPAPLRSALADAWDGSPEMATSIAKLLNAAVQYGRLK